MKSIPWRIICAILMIIIVALSIHCYSIHKENIKLKQLRSDSIKQECYTLYRMTDTMQKHYINSDNKDTLKYELYLNQTCYNFTYILPNIIPPSDLTSIIRDYLLMYYDPFFKSIAYEKISQEYMDEALLLFEEMTKGIYDISLNICNSDEKYRLNLQDIKSKEFISLNEKVEKFTTKYSKLIENFYYKFDENDIDNIHQTEWSIMDTTESK